MADPVDAWHAEHVRFVQVLNLLEQQVGVFHEGGSPEYALMLDAVSYLREVGDRQHHPREDAAFDRLVAHEPALRLPVNRLLQEHRVIAASGDELTTLLNEVLDGALIERETVEAAAALYLTYFRHHLETEERSILPRAARQLDAADWAGVRQAAPAGQDEPASRAWTDSRYHDLLTAIDEPRVRQG